MPQCGRACLALDILHVARAFGLLSWTMLFHQSTHCLCSFSCFPVRFRAHPGQTGLQSRLVLHSFGVQHSLVVCRWSIWDVTTIIHSTPLLYACDSARRTAYAGQGALGHGGIGRRAVAVFWAQLQHFCQLGMASAAWRQRAAEGPFVRFCRVSDSWVVVRLAGGGL